jgi:hypothetical protein
MGASSRGFVRALNKRVRALNDSSFTEAMCRESAAQAPAASMEGAGHAGKLRVLALNM